METMTLGETARRLGISKLEVLEAADRDELHPLQGKGGLHFEVAEVERRAGG